MFAIRSYFVVIMSLMGMILAFRPIGYDEEQSFFISILNEHNKYRLIHGSSKLNFSPYTSLLKKTYLNKNSFNLSDPQNFGVNKFSMHLNHDSILDDKLAEKLVGSWYEKGKNYNYVDKSANNNADEFTQIVWAKTEQLSLMMGVENDILYVIATYSPKGNIAGEYEKNVINPQNINHIQINIE